MKAAADYFAELERDLRELAERALGAAFDFAPPIEGLLCSVTPAHEREDERRNAYIRHHLKQALHHAQLRARAVREPDASEEFSLAPTSPGA